MHSTPEKRDAWSILEISSPQPGIHEPAYKYEYIRQRPRNYSQLTFSFIADKSLSGT
jgi:hypothetical protein